jgi:hypothetical protein
MSYSSLGPNSYLHAFISGGSGVISFRQVAAGKALAVPLDVAASLMVSGSYTITKVPALNSLTNGRKSSASVYRKTDDDDGPYIQHVLSGPPLKGMLGLESGWHEAEFDKFNATNISSLVTNAVTVASCNLQGNWNGPPGGGQQIKIEQEDLQSNFTFYYSPKLGWVAGTIVGANVTIPNYAGVVGTSPYPSLHTKASAPPCSLLTFSAVGVKTAQDAIWCKYPFCPHAEPPQPTPPISPPMQVRGSV